MRYDSNGALYVNSGGGTGGGGTSDTTEATQLAVKVAVQSIDTAQGAKADVRASWYDSAASLVSLAKLLIASYVGAGSHVYSYNASGRLVTDAWTLFGVTRTKTYTYTGAALTSETDWV